MGHFSNAEEMFQRLAEQAKGSTQFEPVVLTAYADWLAKRGNNGRAILILNTLATSHPDFDVSERLEAA